MASKDARRGASGASKWKVHISLVIGGVAVLAVCIAVRHFWGAGSANAQVPAQRPANSNAQPASAPAQTPANAAPAQLDSRQLTVMAVANGQQITRQDLARECLLRYGTEVLESMVNKHLILDACQQRGIVITEKDISDEISKIATKFGLSTDRWLTMLEQERNIKPQQYGREIVWPTLALRQLAAKEIQVTKEEVDRAFESELGPKVKARIIAVTSRQKADQLRAAAAANPDDFGELAKNHSEDTNSASAYGLIPPIRLHVGDPGVERAAFALRKGEVSQVISVANQYLILKCEEHIGPATITLAQRKNAEERIVDHLREPKLRTAAAELFKQLQAQARIVNVYNDPARQQQLPGIAAMVNDRQITIRDLAEECILRHGKDVLEGEINRVLLMQELARRNVTVAERDLDEEIARAADSYGFLNKDGTPNVNEWLKTVTEEDGATVELYVRDAVWPTVALKKIVSGGVTVSNDDLQKGFESNYGERVEVLAIVLNNHRQAQQVWDMARNNDGDRFFGDLAEQYSIEPVSRANNGKVPPIQRFGGQPLVEEAAFKLKPGELSGIIAVGDKFAILRCLGRTQPVVRDYNAVKDELYKDIHEKKLRLLMAKTYDDLREVAQIDNFLAGTSQSGKQARVASDPRPGTSGISTTPRPAPLGPAPATTTAPIRR
jgi:parvulin-like peptidyl-prolyl isomerase